ncbi:MULTISPECIES: CPBP family intramembrane glutamic endopeptidase [Paenibacillus]|uniref:CPBP family intramembrane glutamic endopeptidase n=1 Tax=Paenibacillus TaxID=44249 RepID=UPI0020415A7A|nr:CPBP family intramembrane glutamic endopeptidase [Paenibacillus illinoisensis]MCM3204762.1 CPBP family intramembrane metalloprotease [Paenibacillus illinoisensis]
MIYFCLSLLLAFSHKLVEVVIRKLPFRNLDKHAVLLWAVMIGLLIPFFHNEYVFKIPIHFGEALPIFGFLVIANVIAARFSGYNPIGSYNIINFVLTYPIVEEIIYRGLILPNIEPLFGSSKLMDIFYMPVTIPVIITAVLFAICHLQYYNLSSESIRFMIFACIGGIVLGSMTLMTESIVFALGLHMIFNSCSVLYSKRIIKI